MTEILTILSTISAFRDIILIIIVILGFRYLGKEINKGVKKAPEWIEDYFKLRDQQLRKEWAKGVKK